MSLRSEHLQTLLLLLSVCLAESKMTETYKVMTYNAALLGASISVDGTIPDNREERRDALIKYLNDDANSDIVCLQEIFTGQDVEAIVNGVGSKFLYTYSELHLSDGTLPPQSDVIWAPACDTTDYLNFANCAIGNGCLSSTSDTILSPVTYACLVTKCPTEFQTIVFVNGEKCVSCLIRNSPNNHFKRCAGPPSTDRWSINKIGLLLLSKKEISDTEAIEYFPNDINIFAYGYLRAKVGDLTIGCTHIVPTDFNFPPLMSQFQTFSDQQAVELQKFVDAFAGANPVIALGDFNCGPDTDTFDPVDASNYEILTGFFTTKLTEEGTFTSENAYNKAPGQSYNYAIDHVFSAGSARILNTEVILKNGTMPLGSSWLPYSDHYGVKAVVKVKKLRK
ncbi:uncharacterized protein LOC132759253 [Ruditapes philippinarum]|uniref:uncharacterized protein LOC132759253 n=1 Tax=Ruditapes philippinarum TaxID=129788 RepID=UPI00295A6009|nr:uncharacterized protein LOC132759253 [Ruditapes philippinarum]